MNYQQLLTCFWIHYPTCRYYYSVVSMFAARAVSILSYLYIGSLIAIPIITNIYPFLVQTLDIRAVNVEIENSENEALMLGVLLNQFVIFIIGKYSKFICVISFIFQVA